MQSSSRMRRYLVFGLLSVIGLIAGERIAAAVGLDFDGGFMAATLGAMLAGTLERGWRKIAFPFGVLIVLGLAGLFGVRLDARLDWRIWYFGTVMGAAAAVNVVEWLLVSRVGRGRALPSQ
jgi:hypothetical protein